MRCSGCPFTTPVIEASEIYKRDILIVGEAPGKTEIRKGKPFVGPSGDLLWKTLATFGVKREDCAVTNAMECFIPQAVYDKKASVVQEPAMSCRHRLVDEIRVVKPNLVMALGNIAMQSLLQDFSMKITNTRGTIHDLLIPGRDGEEDFETKVLATFHPAAILRNPNDFRKFRRDLAYAHHLSKGGTPKSPGETEYIAIESPDDPRFAEAVAEIYKSPKDERFDKWVVGADIETNSLDPLSGGVLAIGFSPRKNFTVIFGEECIASLYDLLTDEEILFVWHNGKFDTKFLQRAGIPARVDHDTILLHYCVDPKTRILTSDLRWKQAGELREGDELIGFPENSRTVSQGGPGIGLNYQPTKVLATKRQIAPTYKLTFSDGKEVICSENHSWLVSRPGQNYLRWMRTKDMVGKRVIFRSLIHPWEETNDYDSGYISGILDGEGCLSSTFKNSKTGQASGWGLTFAQKEGPVLDKALAILSKNGFEVKKYLRKDSGVAVVHFRGMKESLRALGAFRPVRLMDKAQLMWQGNRKANPVNLTSIEFLGDREVIGIETESKTFIAEGLLSHNCLDEQKGTHDLKQLSTYHLGAGDYSGEFKEYMPEKGATFADAPKHALYTYLSKDCDYTRQLFYIFYNQVSRDKNLNFLYTKLLIPLSAFLLKVEQRGIWANPEYLDVLKVQLEKEIEDVKAELLEIVDEYWDELEYAFGMDTTSVPDQFNPGSPKQLQWLLYQRMRLRPTNRKRNTNEETLRSIPPNPVVDKILQYRGAKKKLGTYVDGMRKHIGVDGRIHGTFMLFGTTTGRIASADPNTQNIPREKNIKDIFQAPKGRYIMDLDLAQAELRVLAALSGDETLTNVFKSGRDLHSETAELIWGTGFTKEDRTAAKSVNFGICYGLTAGTLVKQKKAKNERAGQKMIDGWMRAYPVAWKWLQTQRGLPIKGKYAESPFGRRRRFPLITEKALNGLENESSNHAIQGTASDLNLILCMEIDEILETKYDALIVNIVHDSIIIECPEDPEIVVQIEKLAQTHLSKVAKEWLHTDVPFKMDGKFGKSWGSAEDITDELRSKYL